MTLERLLPGKPPAHRAVAPHHKLCQRRTETTGSGIDALVYELYGLTEEEIATVEGRDH